MIRLIFGINEGLIISWCARERKGKSSTNGLKFGGKVINDEITEADFLGTDKSQLQDRCVGNS